MATDALGNPLLSPKEKKCGDSDKDGELDVTEEEEEDEASGPGAAKTPVSLLQELYVRRGITPKYDLVQIEGTVQEEGEALRSKVHPGQIDRSTELRPSCAR